MARQMRNLLQPAGTIIVRVFAGHITHGASKMSDISLISASLLRPQVGWQVIGMEWLPILR
jgi:hypothetical protein